MLVGEEFPIIIPILLAIESSGAGLIKHSKQLERERKSNLYSLLTVEEA
jgi:hypothetical protein